MKLFRTTNDTDWKGRPNHQLRLMGESDDRAVLIELMNQDVQQWQTNDLVWSQDTWDQDVKDYGSAEGPRPTQWANSSRFEMELSEGEDLRQFSEGCEGEFTTICYHILD